MRKYFCDRCGKELSRSELLNATVDVGYERESGAVVGQQKCYDLCARCANELSKFFDPLAQEGGPENAGKK